MVKTQCRCGTSMTLNDIEVVLSMNTCYYRKGRQTWRTKGRITTVNDFFYILNDRVTRMLEINHFFKMVNKNLL